MGHFSLPVFFLLTADILFFFSSPKRVLSQAALKLSRSVYKNIINSEVFLAFVSF